MLLEEREAAELLPFALLGRFNKRAGNLFFDENRAETIFTLFSSPRRNPAEMWGHMTTLKQEVAKPLNLN